MLSIAFMEVIEDQTQLADYRVLWSPKSTPLPFDYVWFTGKAEREDQCEKMKAHMKKKQKKNK